MTLNCVSLSRCAVAAALLLMAIEGEAVRGQMSFIGLGQVENSTHNRALELSNDGSTVLGRGVNLSTSTAHIYRWNLSLGASTIWSGSTASAPQFQPQSLSAVGSIVAGGCTNAGPAAVGYYWSELSGFTNVAGPAPNSTGCVAAVSGDGGTFVGRANTGAYKVSAGQPIQSLAGIAQFTTTDALHSSFDGSVIVGTAARPGESRAIRWTPQGSHLLPTLPNSVATIPRDVSADGQIVVGYSSNSAGARTPFVWDPISGMQTLPDFNSGVTTPTDVSANGLFIVGDTSLPFIGNQAVAWLDRQNAVNLNDFLSSVLPAGWNLTEASGISDDGRVIVGSGIHNGVLEPWIATIPEPATLTLVVLAAIALTGRRSFIRRRSTGYFE